jgi:hypothetical protein
LVTEMEMTIFSWQVDFYFVLTMKIISAKINWMFGLFAATHITLQ